MLTNRVKRSRLLRSVVRRSHGSIDRRYLTKHIAKAIRAVSKIDYEWYSRTKSNRLKSDRLESAFVWKDTPQGGAFWVQLDAALGEEPV